MKGFIELKSKNFKTVNVDSIKMIEQVRERTRLRYVLTDDSEFVEVFETEEEFQDRLQNVRKFLMDEISPEEYIKTRQKEEQLTEQFNRLIQGYTIGVVKDEEIRSFIFETAKQNAERG